jgi:hypothetical protein
MTSVISSSGLKLSALSMQAAEGSEVANISRARRPSGLRRRVEGAGGLLSGVLSGIGAARTEMPPPPIAGAS